MKTIFRSTCLVFCLSLFFLFLTTETIPAQESTTTEVDRLNEDPNKVIPAEPGAYDKEEVDSFLDRETGLYFRLFDLNKDGKVNYMTARRTNSSYMNEFWNSVIYKFQYPLFYWIDLNGNGKFEPELGEMWIDPEEDGLNGNEHIYYP